MRETNQSFSYGLLRPAISPLTHPHFHVLHRPRQRLQLDRIRQHTGAAPGNGDDVTIAAIPGLAHASVGAVDMSSVTLNNLTISRTYTCAIGATATSGTLDYWKISATAWTIGTPSNDGAIGSGPPLH